MRKNVVIIGLGKIARYHIAALGATPQYVVCGVCDIDPHAVARAECPDVPFYTNYEQLLDTLHPEIAVIATPPALHYAIGLRGTRCAPVCGEAACDHL